MIEGYHSSILNKKEKAFLLPVAPQVSVRSGIDSVTLRVNRYVDTLLQPLVSQTPSYLKDTIQVINILNLKLNGGEVTS